MMFDFEAEWFKDFRPPMIVNDPNYACIDEENPAENLIEIEMSRNSFLDSFTLTDEASVEFQLQMDDETLGRLQLIKTRDWFLVEAHVPFELTPTQDME